MVNEKPKHIFPNSMMFYFCIKCMNMKCILTLLRYTSISTTWAVHWKEEKSLQHDLFESTECLLEQTGIVSKTSTPITHANTPTHILTYTYLNITEYSL